MEKLLQAVGIHVACIVAGCVMYQTTPEEPAHVVGKLCHKHSSEAVLLGSYHLQDRTVSVLYTV